MTESNDNLAQPKVSDHYDFYKLAKKTKTTVISSSSCKLCQSAFRKDCERMRAEGQSYASIHSFLRKQGEEISKEAVRMHFIRHFDETLRRENLREYAKDLHEWAKISQSTEDSLRHTKSILERRLHYIEANTNDSDIDSQRKTADTTVKLAAEINKIESRLDEIRKDKEPIQVLLYKFQEIVQNKIEDVDSSETLQVLQDIIAEFQREVEDIANTMF